MYGILRMPHMVSVDKYTVNCKEILVEYYFNISLFSQTAVCEIYLRFSLFEAKNCPFFVFYFVASSWYASPSLHTSQSFCLVLCRDILRVIVVLIGKR